MPLRAPSPVLGIVLGVVLTLCASLAASCARPHAIYDASLADLEAVRDRIERVEVILLGEAGQDLRLPARGPWGGAKRGFVLGAAWPVIIGILTPIPFGFLIGLALTPLGSLVGSVVGAVNAPPASRVDAASSELMSTLAELTPGLVTGLRDEIVVAGRARTTLTFGASVEDADARLFVLPRALGLRGAYALDPPCSAFFSVDVRLVHLASGRVELEETFVCASEKSRKLFGWAAETSSLFRGEARRFPAELAEKIVDDLFLTLPIQP